MSVLAPERDPDGMSVATSSALSVGALSTREREFRACSIRHNAAGGAHRRDRIRQVDRGRPAARRRAPSWSTPTRSRVPSWSRAPRRWPRSSSASAPASSTRDGRLDRPALAAIAFADDDGRKALGEITWPAIGEEFERRIRTAPPDGVVVCDVPLLVESKAAAARPYVAVIVVEAPIDLRLDRLELRGVAPRRRRTPDGRPGDRRGAARGRHPPGRQRRRPRFARRVRSTGSGPTSSPADPAVPEASVPEASVPE